MVGSTGTIMTMCLIHSKLRKREESLTVLPTPIEAQQMNLGSSNRSSSANNTCESRQQHQQLFTLSSGQCSNGSNNSISSHHSSRVNAPGLSQEQYWPRTARAQLLGQSNISDQEQITFTRTSGGISNSNGWIFPPKVPTPKFYNYNIDEPLGAQNDKSGFKGFRKQFSGRFKRLLVAKKTEPVPPAIPHELKPQLRTIYVY